LADRRVKPKWRSRLEIAAFTLLLTAGMGFVLASELLLTRQVSVREGQAASEDIAAPTRIEFESEILTKLARARALADVKDVYDPLDRQVGREQVNRAQQILDFVDSVRADSYASPEYQRYCLESIQDVDLSPQVISDTITLSEPDWKAVQLEVRRVLAQVMREEIKSGQEDVYRRSVRVLIAFELSEPQTAIVNEIASGLVEANRLYNKEATEAARQAALESVQPQMRVLEQNEIIVRSGEIVTAEHIEALRALGLLDPQVDWLAVSGTFLFVLLLAAFASSYVWAAEPDLLRRPHHLLLLLLLLVLFTLLAKWGVSQPMPQPYVAPLAMLGMLVTVLFNVRLGLVAQVTLCVAVGYMTGGRLDLFLYYLAGGLMGIFALRRATRMNTFVWAGMYVMLSNVVVVLIFALLNGDVDTLSLGQAILISLVSGALAAVLALGGYYLLGMLFDIATSLQLLDLARPTHPLMRELLLKAPGTYHHSIMVGNMAEQAAEAIDADALLARVGAFYHDIGKTVRPYFFTENQVEGSNPHDLLDPETSVQIIRSHTSDGLALARRYHLPHAVRTFISEHHGASKISFFYHKAREEYGPENVDPEKYRHLGPLPQSKETAIVMLADSCEAAVRSVRPPDAEALERLIRHIVSDKVASGQLDDAPLTLKEIHTLASSFVDTLQGVFHPRIRYPSTERELEPAAGEHALPSGDGSSVEAGPAPVASLPAEAVAQHETLPSEVEAAVMEEVGEGGDGHD
jgi:putative nucleotidyltransferase with HDIG domain